MSERLTAGIPSSSGNRLNVTTVSLNMWQSSRCRICEKPPYRKPVERQRVFTNHALRGDGCFKIAENIYGNGNMWHIFLNW